MTDLPALVARVHAAGWGLKVLAAGGYGPVLGLMPPKDRKLARDLDDALAEHREDLLAYVQAAVKPFERGGTTVWELPPGGKG